MPGSRGRPEDGREALKAASWLRLCPWSLPCTGPSCYPPLPLPRRWTFRRAPTPISDSDPSQPVGAAPRHPALRTRPTARFVLSRPRCGSRWRPEPDTGPCSVRNGRIVVGSVDRSASGDVVADWLALLLILRAVFGERGPVACVAPAGGVLSRCAAVWRSVARFSVHVARLYYILDL